MFSIFGLSKSGKTSTAEAVISELCRRNYSVGSVKDIHFEGFALDRTGTDTSRHKYAGSQLVIARGLSETDVLYPGRLSLKQVLCHFDQDFVVMEGTNQFKGPGIICAYTEQEIDERLRESVFAVAGRISDRISEYKGLPVINALTDVGKLVDLIEASVPEWTGQSGWLEQN